ncbi:MAG: DNA mismatch repair protein MutS, partial [Peptococcia bacterium]
MAGKTPMMRQYNEIKKQYPNAILFFRLGDFYEMFGEDAQVASRELEITLTGRDAGMKERIPMCGVPYHAAESHIARLIQKGYKVAVCEQVEDPRTAKGIVKREVVRVITPGTVLDSQLLEKQTSTYLTALCYQNYAWGLSVCDVSTGEFWIAEFNGISELQNLKDELSRLNATELLLPTNLQVNELFPPMEQPVLTYLAEEFFSYRQAEQTILRHFKVNSLEALGCRDFRAAVSSAGAVLNYLQDTQKLPPQQIKTLKLYSPDNTMVLDQTTMRNLELVRTNRFNEKKGSLLDILDKTKTALGGRLLRQWLERPLCDLAVLNKRQMAVEVLCKYWTERQELRAALDEVYDLERIMTRVLYQRAMPKELISLKNSLAVLPALQQTLLNLEGSQYIAELSESLDTLEDICSLLEKAVVDDPPYNLKD